MRDEKDGQHEAGSYSLHIAALVIRHFFAFDVRSDGYR
jgi:hypothetical protein